MKAEPKKKGKSTKLDMLTQLDEVVRRMAWDCVILREKHAPVYCFLPPDATGDAAIAAAIGVKISSSLKKPLMINSGNE